MDTPNGVTGNARHSHGYGKAKLLGENHENRFNAFFPVTNIHGLSCLWSRKSNG
jgi:hypothetical protein